MNADVVSSGRHKRKIFVGTFLFAAQAAFTSAAGKGTQQERTLLLQRRASVSDWRKEIGVWMCNVVDDERLQQQKLPPTRA